MVKTQKEQILKYLKTGKSITALEALEKFGCFRLASVIHKLRDTFKIEGELITKNGKTFSKYFILKENRS